MNQPLKASSPQHNAIGGPLPVLLDFRNGGRGWRMSLGALVQATLLGLVLVLPLLMTDSFAPQPMVDSSLPPYQRGSIGVVDPGPGEGTPPRPPRINTAGTEQVFTYPLVNQGYPIPHIPTGGGGSGPGGDQPGVEWGVDHGVPVDSPVKPPALTPQPPPPPADTVLKGGDVRRPRLIHRVEPEYPRLAKLAGIQGDVVLEALLDKDGRVRNVEAKSGHPMLNEAAKEAVGQWVYEPTYLNGVPYPVLLTVTVEFRLKR